MDWKKLIIFNEKGSIKWWDFIVIFICAISASEVMDRIDPNDELAFYVHLPLYVLAWIVTMFVCCFLKAVIWDKLIKKNKDTE